MSKTKLKICERCKQGLYDPTDYKQCRLCYLKYTKECKCRAKKLYDSFLYKQCYDCSQRNPKKQSMIINVDDLDLLPENE